MELNTKGRYAVMAMADLAHQAAVGARITDVDESVPLSAIAERQHLSLPYLDQVFAKLRRAGLVDSARGRTGGYRLARAASEITIAEIMDAVEEAVKMTRCGGDDVSPCLPGERCMTHGLWDALGAHINAVLSATTLQQVIEGGPPRGASLSAPPALFSGGVLPQ